MEAYARCNDALGTAELALEPYTNLEGICRPRKTLHPLAFIEICFSLSPPSYTHRPLSVRFCVCNGLLSEDIFPTNDLCGGLLKTYPPYIFPTKSRGAPGPRNLYTRSPYSALRELLEGARPL